MIFLNDHIGHHVEDRLGGEKHDHRENKSETLFAQARHDSDLG